MIKQRISIVMGLWAEGYFTDSEVISWADKQIIEIDGDIYDPLIELSLKGPKVCVKKASYDFPDRMEFSYQQRFAIRLMRLDLSARPDIRKFISWVASNAMGEDRKSPEVMFGYHLDHYLDYDEIDPEIYFERNIQEYIDSSETLVRSLLQKANA